jgi:hypothetical protein
MTNAILNAIAEWYLLILGGFIVYRMVKFADLSLPSSALLGGLAGAVTLLGTDFNVILSAMVAGMVGIIVATMVLVFVLVLRVSAVISSVAIIFVSYLPALWIINGANPFFSTQISTGITLPDAAISSQTDLIVYSIIFIYVLFLLLFGSTKYALRSAFVVEMGPNANKIGYKWSRSCVPFLLIGHIAAALGGFGVIVRNESIDLNYFNFSLFWVFAGIAIGESVWTLLSIMRSRLEDWLPITKRLVFSGFGRPVLLSLVVSGVIGLVIEIAFSISTSIVLKGIVGVLLVSVVVFERILTRFVNAPAKAWTFHA